MDNLPFRSDKYGKSFFIVYEGKTENIPFKTGLTKYKSLSFNVKEETTDDDVTKLTVVISSSEKIFPQRLGMRLGIDCYMDKFPDWNGKFFPTALRCEHNGFWSCFVSPLGEAVSFCSPSKIVSWANEYNMKGSEVGHRIYTSSIDFINLKKQPPRHPKSPEFIDSKESSYEIYFKRLSSVESLRPFVKKYAGIDIPETTKYTLENGEKLFIDGKEYQNELKDGVNYIDLPSSAQMSVYVRKDWFYYLDAARKSAEKCQQKPGTHTESWYGYFSLAEYAKIINDEAYTKALCERFDKLFNSITKGKEKHMKKKAMPKRLQNTSCMLSLLADFYELTGNEKYLDYADELASRLMELQSSADGSYRSGATHYTCVIYPAKSMLELSVTEKKAGRTKRAEVHFESAKRAIDNLYILKDNIGTEGEMTFEDGMISCESLQLGYLAMLTDDEYRKRQLTAVAKEVLKKHFCLEQQIIPDCRTRGCTARFWEARYDVNFFANMLNSPHGWTSWKTYATYYLYMLTGEKKYLEDTMNTIGACMQCVDADGVLSWAYIADPCVTGENLVKGCSKNNIEFKEETVGEQYLPMISDWYRQDENKLVYQYLRYFSRPSTWKRDYGGSCDNDVHEHFKCLCETVFGKAFIHEDENGEYTCYNCKKEGDEFTTDDKYVKTLIVKSNDEGSIIFGNNVYELQEGINEITI